MKKKQKFSLPDSKIILLTSLILIVGVIMLFVSIFLSPSQNQNDTVLETIIVQKEEKHKTRIFSKNRNSNSTKNRGKS